MSDTTANNYKHKRVLTSSLLAFIGYGSWSIFANFSHSMEIITKIVLVYGSYSAIATFVYSNVMEYFYHRLIPRQYAFAMTIMLICMLMYSTTVAVNIVAGTPELLLTIAPGIIISTFFAVGYVKVLKIKVEQ